MNEKTRLITLLREVFQRWEELLTGISEEQITAPDRIERLSIKDIVAHLTAWQELSVAHLQAVLNQRDPVYPAWPPELDPELEDDLDHLNAWIYATYRDRAWSEVHREWSGRFLHFLECCEALSEAELVETGKHAWLEDYQLSVVLLGSYEHHEEHLEPLLALLRQNGK